MANEIESQVYGVGAAAPPPVLKQVVPTVFIGLGGSGQQVLMRLRKRFHERDPNSLPPYLRFLFIDTDSQAFVPDREAPEDYAEMQPRPNEQVACAINEKQFNRVFDGLESGVDSAHLSWLKPGLRGLGAQTLVNGAGTYRQFGRLAFFLYYRDIREKIERQIKDVLKYAAEKPGEVETKRIEIVIVTSLVGGTGSGMFIDVAYLVRDIVGEAVYERMDSKYVTLIGFLPTLWEEDQSGLYPKFQRNAYAALLELEYYGTPRTGDELFMGDSARQATNSSRMGFHVTWNGEDRYLRGPAWGSCFLIDNINDLVPNAALPRNEVFQMVSDYLFLDFEQHGFAVRKRSARSNLVQYKDRWHATWVRRLGAAPPSHSVMVGTEVVYATQNGCGFSTFGLSEIYFDLEKLYQASGYRLAWQLVQWYWLGASRKYPEETVKAWVKADLGEGRRRPGQDQPPTFRAESLIRRVLTGQSGCLLDALDAELSGLESIEPDQGLDELREMVARHEALLTADGPVQQTVTRILGTLRGTPQNLGPLRERLRWLVLDHLADHGITATLSLLAQYHKALLQVGAGLNKTPAEALNSDALARLKEAGTIGRFVRRRAQQIEYPRALDAVTTYLRRKYSRLAARSIEPDSDSASRSEPASLMTRMSRYIGSANQRPGPELSKLGTLYDLCIRAQAFLGQIEKQLDDRFRKSQKEEDQGFKRKRSLSSGWDPRRYDERINEALVQDVEIGSDAGGAGGPEPYSFNWELFEAKVIDNLKESSGADAANTRADFWVYWLEHESNPGDVNRVAERLAEACRLVIRRQGLNLSDVEHGNAVDLLMSKEETERQEQIDRLVMTSYPYLPMLGQETIADLMPAFTNLYGQKPGAHDPNTPKTRNAATIAALVTGTASNLTKGPGGQIPEPLPAMDSSLLLVREVSGFPLQYYSRLGQLQKAYLEAESYTRGSDECHIDFHESWRDLPDIRPVGIGTYTRVRENIDYVLYGMMLGVIVWEEGEFRVKVPHRLGGAPDTYSLGIHIHRLVKFACEDESICNHLIKRWSDWSGNKATTKHWVALFASALKTYYVVKNQVISLDRGKQQSPPVRNCFEALAERVAKRLEMDNDGPRWSELLRQSSEDGFNGPVAYPIGSVPQTKLDEIAGICLVQVRKDLPIFQIVEAKVASIPDLPAGPSLPIAAGSTQAGS